MPPRKKSDAQSKSKLIAQQKLKKRLALIAQEQEHEEQELSDDQLLGNMASVRRMNTTSEPSTGIDLNFYEYAGTKEAKAKETNKGKAKDVVTKKRRKDGLDTPQSLPPRGKDQGRKIRLGADTRGEVWESGRDRSKLVIRESTGAVEEEDEQDEEESEEEDNEIDPTQLANQSQGVVEEGGPSQQPTQGKGKGKEKVKVKSSHLPHVDDMIPDLDRGRIWGASYFDPRYLFGYKDSWARTIYRTYDHKKAVRVCRNQAATHWDLSKEHEEVQAIVKDSGLYPLVENYVKPDMVTVNCFVERYHGETDTMHFPFGETTLILDDAQNIIGLDVIDKLIAERDDHSFEIEWTELHELTNKLLGWDNKTSVEIFYASKIRYTTAAYLLFILGTRVFPDTSSNKVSENYLQYLDPLEEVFTYSWGTVAMTHLMTEMRRASKVVANQFVGNFTLLQVWDYEHFPTLLKDNPFLKFIPVDDPEEPRAKRYEFNSHLKPGNNHRMEEMRLAMDAMTTKYVLFDPYKEARENRQYKWFYNVALYQGPLFHPKGYVMADPRRVMRQLGNKKLPRCMTSSHERDREPRHLVDATNWEPVNNGDEADPTYIDDYLELSYPFVVRPEDVEVPPQKNPPVPTPIEAPHTMTQLNKTVGLLRCRLGKLKKMLGCMYEEGEVLSLEEMKEVVEKLGKIEDPSDITLFGERRKVSVSKKQKTK
ncbi:hypothetical protein C5167_009451 [Papaver somniferum]|uniref:Aminotransferase-like plant mobile domain-containing protein n=1 Tax=Papaver somniferum TaxID=3469 RepID=A0A4Y7K1C4_PAPSO|nr:hypothetical protein C5167_009451 [Papaver somniferum]